MVRDSPILAAACLGFAALAIISRTARARARAVRSRLPARPPAAGAVIDNGGAVGEARKMNRAAGIIAMSVLVDSAVEHYRGSFHNKAMFVPLAAAASSVAVSVHGNADRRAMAHRMRDSVYAATALAGLAGTCFHIFNIGKKPGGFSWQNLFYSAPVGAPAALILSGTLGFLAERVRNTPPGSAPTIAGMSAGRVVAAATSLGLFGTVGEAGLLHFRGAYHDPFMYLPVTVPPVAAVLIGNTALDRTRKPRPIARFWLRFTALLGFAGASFHVIGVGRNMGGWRNWRQNVLNGPPIPAPPSFTGLALAGLAALRLLEGHSHD